MLAQNNTTRGSIMIAALIITLITGTLVGLFLKTVVQEVENTHRGRMGFQAINLAEAGVEYAMHAMIQDRLDEWQSTASGGYYRAAFPHIDITTEAQNDDDSRLYRVRSSLRNDNRSLRVYLEPEWENANGDKVPVVIAEGAVVLNNGMAVRRQVRVEMKQGSNKPWKRGWGNGILGNFVKFNGNGITVDSYRSSVGDYMTYYWEDDPFYLRRYYEEHGEVLSAHDRQNRNGQGSVATIDVEVDALSGSATIIGGASTKATEGELSKQLGVVSLKDYDPNSKNGIDYDRVTYDFYAELPNVILPTFDSPTTSLPSTRSVSGLNPKDADDQALIRSLSNEFPSLGFTGVRDGGKKAEIVDIDEIGNYESIALAFADLDNNGSLDSISIEYGELSIVSDPTYKLDEIVVSSGQLYLFTSQTALVVDNEDLSSPARTYFDGGMMVGTSASVEFYLAGGFDVTTKGMVNTAGHPTDLQIFVAKLNDSWDKNDMLVSVGGNGTFAAAIYAPQSDISLNGGGNMGDVFGALVGDNISFNGTNWQFHYDEDLANINPDDDDDGESIPKVDSWRELTHAGEKIADWAALVQNGL